MTTVRQAVQGGLEDYRQPHKDHWRKWKWNTIKRKLKEMKVSIKDARVLYLPGEQDLDRKKMLDIGFKPHNLFGVDKDPRVVARLRKKGVNAICGKIGEVLASWPSSNLIHVVDADLCCGLSRYAFETMEGLLSSEGVGTKCIFSMNLQRGRDRNSDSDRLLSHVYRSGTKHRGRACVLLLTWWMGKMYGQQEWGLQLADSECLTSYERELMLPLCGIISEFADAQYSQYKSNRVVMDGFIMKFASRARFRQSDCEYLDFSTVPHTRRRIAAALAISTMRKNGKLSPGAVA